MQDARDKTKGFTLIEVMVSMLIIAISLLALGSLLITTMKNNQGNEQRFDVAAVSRAMIADCASLLDAAGVGVTSTVCDSVANSYPNYTIVGNGGKLQVTLGSAPVVYAAVYVAIKPKDGSRMGVYKNQAVINLAAGINE